MNIQENNIVHVVKVEKLEETFLVEEPCAQIIRNKFDEFGIKVEYPDDLQFIIHKEVDIKDEYEGDQSDIKSCEKETDEIYSDEYQFISHEKIDIKTEETENNPSNSGYGENTLNKGEKRYSWNHCLHQTNCSGTIMRHLRAHRGSVSLTCILCQKSFNEKRHLDSHYICIHSDRSDIWKDILTNSIKNCPKCDYKTIRTSDFKRHLQVHETIEGNYKLKCNFCDFKCIHNKTFTKHLRLHINLLSFACTECNQNFNKKIQLDGHIITGHSQNERLMKSITYKVYHCDGCGFKTVGATTFKRHVLICEFNKAPTVELRFNCNICDGKCFRKDHLAKSLLTHTSQAHIACSKCDKSFKSKIQLDGHILSKHSHNPNLMNSVTSKIHQCNECDFKTVHKTSLKSHQKSCKSLLVSN